MFSGRFPVRGACFLQGMGPGRLGSTDLICFHSWAEGLQDSPASPRFHVSTSQRLCHNLSNLASIDGKGKYLWVICTTNIQVSTKHEPQFLEADSTAVMSTKGNGVCMKSSAKIYKQGQKTRKRFGYSYKCTQIKNKILIYNTRWWCVQKFVHPFRMAMGKL